MGRTPDHVACVLTAFATARDFFAQGGAQFGDNVVRFHERARRDDLYVSYAIVPPQVDRTTPAHQHPEPFLHPGVVKERDDGIVLRGCQAIATSAVLSDWLFLSYITPLAPGDEDYAISVVMPIGAEGVRLYPRRPFSEMATSVYDYPLSARFDEVDTTVVLRDVFVPWEQVFIYRNVELVNRQFHDTPSHTLANFQSLVRFGVKLEFMAGLCLKLAELQRSEGSPAVQAQLGGEIAALCASFDALVHAAARFPLVRDGWARPHPQYIYAGMSLQRRLIVDMMRSIRELAGGAFQAVPSSEQSFLSPDTREDTERYYRLEHGVRARAHQAPQAHLGLRGDGVRRTPAPVRDVLLGVPARGEHAHVPRLRLGRRQGPRRPLPRRVLTRATSRGAAFAPSPPHRPLVGDVGTDRLRGVPNPSTLCERLAGVGYDRGRVMATPVAALRATASVNSM